MEEMQENVVEEAMEEAERTAAAVPVQKTHTNKDCLTASPL
jgi:hypothetical protein